jgi:hypothetical protein
MDYNENVYRVSQEERSILLEVKLSVRMVSELELFHCTIVWIGPPVLSIPPAILRHCLSICMKRQSAVVTVDIDILGVS